MKEEVNAQWRDDRTKMKNKIRHLETKHRPWKMVVEGRYKDIRIGDKELEEIQDEQEEKRRKVPTYGGTETEEPTVKLLQNHPKLALWPKLDMMNIMTEVEKGCVKRRWAEMSKRKVKKSKRS